MRAFMRAAGNFVDPSAVGVRTFARALVIAGVMVGFGARPASAAEVLAQEPLPPQRASAHHGVWFSTSALVMGDGFNLGAGIKRSACVDVVGAPKVPTTGTTEYWMERVTSAEQVRRRSGLSVSASLGLGIFSGSFGYRSELAQNISSNDTSLMLISRVRSDPTSAERYVWNKRGLDAWRRGPTAFLLECGDSFVREVIYGGDFSAVIHGHSRSVEERRKNEAQLEAAYGAFAASSSLKQAVSKLTARESLQVRIVQAGPFSNLPSLDEVERTALDFPCRVFPASQGCGASGEQGAQRGQRDTPRIVAAFVDSYLMAEGGPEDYARRAIAHQGVFLKLLAEHVERVLEANANLQWAKRLGQDHVQLIQVESGVGRPVAYGEIDNAIAANAGVVRQYDALRDACLANPGSTVAAGACDVSRVTSSTYFDARMKHDARKVVRSLRVSISTATTKKAGTDAKVWMHVCTPDGVVRYRLNSKKDDFEKGQTDEFDLPLPAYVYDHDLSSLGLELAMDAGGKYKKGNPAWNVSRVVVSYKLMHDSDKSPPRYLGTYPIKAWIAPNTTKTVKAGGGCGLPTN
jgi:hypothetical protein